MYVRIRPPYICLYVSSFVCDWYANILCWLCAFLLYCFHRPALCVVWLLWFMLHSLILIRACVPCLLFALCVCVCMSLETFNFALCVGLCVILIHPHTLVLHVWSLSFPLCLYPSPSASLLLSVVLSLMLFLALSLTFSLFLPFYSFAPFTRPSTVYVLLSFCIPLISSSCPVFISLCIDPSDGCVSSDLYDIYILL